MGEELVLVDNIKHETQVFPMPQSMGPDRHQAQCACGWKGEVTSQEIAQRQANDHLLVPDGFDGELVGAIEHYAKDERERVGRTEINGIDMAVMKLRSAGWAYHYGKYTEAAIILREAEIHFNDAKKLMNEKSSTILEVEMIQPMIVYKEKVITKEITPPVKQGVRGKLQRLLRSAADKV